MHWRSAIGYIIFVQEVAKCSKDPYPPKTLYQIVCGIRRFMVEKTPAIKSNPLDSSDKRCMNWHYWRGGPFDILKLQEIFIRKSHFFSLDLLSLDEYWTQKWKMGLELVFVWKWNKKKKSQSVCNLKCLSWPLFIKN